MFPTKIRGRYAHSGIYWLGASASVATLYLAYDQFWGDATPDARVGLILLGLFAVFFLVYAMYREYEMGRKSRYAEALASIGRAHLLAAVPNPDNEREVRLLAKDVCDRISHTLSMVTGTRCNACVKVIESEDPHAGIDELEVFTLCRDDQSWDRPQGEITVEHGLADNTDFLQIFENIDHPEKCSYYDNHLPWRIDYQNSSFQVYGRPFEEGPTWFQRIVRYFGKWPLPYKSTVVAPIYPLEPDENDRLLGYLCVDSRSRGVFDRRYDVPVLRSIASALHPLLYAWSDLVWEEEYAEGAP